MTEQPIGPRCGNNPNFRMSNRDRKAVDDFKARLALQAAVKPHLDSAAWVDGDPLMEVIAVTLWERCARDDEDMPQLVRDDPRTIAALAAAVARVSVQPGSVDRAVVYAEVADRLSADAEKGEKEGFTRIYQRAAATKVREWAAEAPLSPYYQHPACGFHWHGRDGMDVPIRDGQPVCPRCELAETQKEAQRLGLMVDEYSDGARRLSDALRTEKERADAAIGRETTAEEAAEEAQRDRDQLAAVLAETLSHFTMQSGDPDDPRVRTRWLPTSTVEQWRTVLHHDVERPWWQQVDEARAELEATEQRASGFLADLKKAWGDRDRAQAAIERVRAYLAELERAGWSQAAIVRRIRDALNGTAGQPGTDQET
jgi:hypothetical protein